MDFLPPLKLKVAQVPGKGLGVFSTQPIAEGELIERCPLILLGESDTAFMRGGSDCLRYYYLHQIRHSQDCLMLGFGSLYNHSKTPNCDPEYDEDRGSRCISYRALREIQIGEELLWDYQFEESEDFLDL